MEFFDQLWEFSKQYARSVVGLCRNHSPWGYGLYKGGSPCGAVIHYTADPDFHRVIRWFADECHHSYVSSEVIIAPKKMSGHDELAKDLPLVRELPVTVFQCRKLGETGWHASWTNRTHFGIENVSQGLLGKEEPGSVFMWGRWWASYPVDQLRTNAIILRHVQDCFGTLSPATIVGHEMVQGVDTLRRAGQPMKTDKRDPGPHFPLNLIREEVFGEGGLDFTDMGNYVRDVAMPLAWNERLIRGLDDILENKALSILGYDVADRETSVKYFQRLSGLAVDGVLGPKTRAALAHRLVDRGACGG